MVMRTILWFCILNVCFGEFWVKWPLGVSWWGWRINLNVNIFYYGYYVHYLYEWDECDQPGDKTNWHCASYEEPRFFKEKSSFIPTFLKRNCDDDGIDIRSLQYQGGREDMRRNKLIVKQLGGLGVYDNWYWHTYIAFLFNMCNCLKGNSISFTCPDPCRKPGVCSVEKNVVKGSCRKIKDPDYQPKLVDGDFKNIYGHLYKFNSVCTCKVGYFWNKKKRKCNRIGKACNIERIGSQVCHNGGKCIPVESDKQVYDFLILRCICPPAWTGYLCTDPVNPCRRSMRLCGSFSCRRDSTSMAKGYYCVCTKGFKKYSDFEPRCMNVDECMDMPCQHGGVCHDLTPDPLNPRSLPYNCTCIAGFSGRDCEVPPRRPEWSSWSPWTVCSRSCGLGGQMVRTRVCTVSGRCSGIARHTAACVLLAVSCDELTSEPGSAGTGVNLNDEQRLKLMGVGWNPDEERILDDSFRWNEQLKPSKSMWNTLGILDRLEHVALVTMLVLSSMLIAVLLINIIGLGPCEWCLLTWRSLLARGGRVGPRKKMKAKRAEVIEDKPEELMLATSVKGSMLSVDEDDGKLRMEPEPNPSDSQMSSYVEKDLYQDPRRSQDGSDSEH